MHLRCKPIYSRTQLCLINTTGSNEILTKTAGSMALLPDLKKNPKQENHQNQNPQQKNRDRLSKNLKIVLHFSLAQGTLLSVFLIQMSEKV